MNPARAKLADLMDATVRNRSNWHYALVRPEAKYTTEDQARHGYVLADCSAGMGLLTKLAHAPNCLAPGVFDGYGNTGTSFRHLSHAQVHDPADLSIGDVVIYGPEWATHHMSMVRVAGADPLLWSNGWEQAPEYVRLSHQRWHQPAPATYFRLMPAESVPAPGPKVDPFWDWLEWYLGEGKYKNHKRDPKRRPKIAPYRITKLWWIRERKFIAARERMNNEPS